MTYSSATAMCVHIDSSNLGMQPFDSFPIQQLHHHISRHTCNHEHLHQNRTTTASGKQDIGIYWNEHALYLLLPLFRIAINENAFYGSMATVNKSLYFLGFIIVPYPNRICRFVFFIHQTNNQR